MSVVKEGRKDVEQKFIKSGFGIFNPLSAKKSKFESVFMPAHASPSLITFQFHSLVVSVSDVEYGVAHARYFSLKGLTNRFSLSCLLS